MSVIFATEYPLGAKTKRARLVALSSYLALLALVLSWHTWLAPHPVFSPYVMLTVWALPLIFPLRGMLQGKAYTHAWYSFILMLYLLHSSTVFYVDAPTRHLSALEFMLTTVSLLSSVYYARWRGQELGLSLRKKKAAN